MSVYKGVYFCIQGVCLYTRSLYVCIQGVCMSVCIQGVCMSVCIYTKYLFVNLFPFIVSKLHPYRLHGQENDH